MIEQAAAAFQVEPGNITVTQPQAQTTMTGDSPTWQVTSTQRTRGLRPIGRTFRGFTALYSAQTGGLLRKSRRHQSRLRHTTACAPHV